MTEPKEKLAPLPLRLFVFAALVGIALLAIQIIDGHVMARAQTMLQQPIETK